MIKLQLLILGLGISTFSYSQKLIKQTCYKKSKDECKVPKKEIYQYDNQSYLIKDYNKNGTLRFIMDSSSTTHGLHGHVQYYSKNGLIHKEGYYANNLITGEWKVYSENGNVSREITYNLDEVIHDTISDLHSNSKKSCFEIMPEFQGGDINSFRRYIQENLFYPPDCHEIGVSGRVFVKFNIDQYGNVGDIEIERGVHKNLDKEAIRVISFSPKWTPGYQDGKPVKIQLTMPILFILTK